MIFENGDRVFMAQANTLHGIYTLVMIKINGITDGKYNATVLDALVCQSKNYKFGMKLLVHHDWIEWVPLCFSKKAKKILSRYSGYVNIFVKQLNKINGNKKEVVIFS